MNSEPEGKTSARPMTDATLSQHRAALRPGIQFRAANPQDAAVASMLIRSSGVQAVDYAFASAARGGDSFVALAFAEGGGLFGWGHHVIALLDDHVAGISAGYGAAAYHRMCLQHVWQVLRHRATRAPTVLHRSLHLRSLMPPPRRGMHYLAHVAVSDGLRGRGVGRAIVEHQRLLAEQRRCSVLALDVAVDNPRALALYERCGLRVMSRNRFSGPAGRLNDTLRMEMRL